MKNILITGGSGFVGSFLIPQMIDKRFNILGISRTPEKLKAIYKNKLEVCSIHQTDVIKNFHPNLVINLATFSTSQDDFENQEKIIDANILFLSHLLDSLKTCNIDLFVNTGTFAEYYSNDGNFDPAYFYAATKTAGRYIIKYFSNTYSFKTITLVPYSIYGPLDKRKKLIHFLIESLGHKEPVKTTLGYQLLDFIYIEDIVNAFISVIEKANSLTNDLTLPLGLGEGHTIRELVNILEKITSKKANISWGALPYRERDIMKSIADIEFTKKVLDWTPTYSLENGLQKMLKIDKLI